MANSQQHQNPDYYAETASLGPTPQHMQQQNQAHQQHPLQSNPTAGYSQQQQQYYYPPPPTAPQQQHQGQQQPYYPPPPSAPHQQPYSSPVPPPSSPGKPPGSSNGGGSSASTSTTSKPTFGERLHQWSVKAGVPINKLTNQLGSEAFWPSGMDKECDKAARILQSFCKNGFYATPDQSAPAGGPKSKSKVLVKIPPKVIQQAAGLAIFTTFRTGLHISGAGGSGVVVSRLPDGSWSPPSGFLVHTLGAGFMIGLDIYDCVCVLRTPEAVRAFTRPRVSLGGEIGLVAGPVGAGASIEAALASSTKPVWAYMKSRGLYAGIQADGTIVVARNDANAAFYGQKGVGVEQILRGEVPARGPDGMWPGGARHLMEALKSAEGRRDVNEAVLKEVDAGPTPGDLGVGEKDHEVQLQGSQA